MPPAWLRPAPDEVPPFRLVFRRYRPFAQYDLTEKARREFGTMGLLARHGIAVPSPLLLDDTGELLGGPGIVTKWADGHRIFEPTDPTRWAVGLASTLAKIHSVPVGPQDLPHLLDGDSEVSWFIGGEAPPEFMLTHPQGSTVWEHVKDHFPRRQKPHRTVLRVASGAGNILWTDDAISAVLDWEEASYGDPGYDVAYCRLDLVMLGLDPDRASVPSHLRTAAGLPANLALWELAAAARPMFGWGDGAKQSPGSDRLARFVTGAIERLRG